MEPVLYNVFRNEFRNKYTSCFGWNSIFTIMHKHFTCIFEYLYALCLFLTPTCSIVFSYPFTVTPYDVIMAVSGTAAVFLTRPRDEGVKELNSPYGVSVRSAGCHGCSWRSTSLSYWNKSREEADHLLTKHTQLVHWSDIWSTSSKYRWKRFVKAQILSFIATVPFVLLLHFSKPQSIDYLLKTIPKTITLPHKPSVFPPNSGMTRS